MQEKDKLEMILKTHIIIIPEKGTWNFVESSIDKTPNEMVMLKTKVNQTSSRP